jgi:hypothetical protein
MNFANPLALLWLGLAAPIVIFYILKIRLRRVPVSTVMFWSQIFEEKRPQSIWQRLRHLVSLLVQLAFLLLVGLALADPFWSWEKLQAQRIVLVVDNSASMNATDVAPSRLAAARDRASRLVRSLRARDEMAIVSVGSVPKVVCGLTGHQRTLQHAIDAIEPTDSPTRVPAAIELARRLLADHAHPRIVLVSDGCFVEAKTLADEQHVELITVGTKAANVGITQFQARRSLVDTIGYQVQLEVQNFSDEPAECRLEIDLDETPVDVLPLKLAAGERFSRTIDHASAEGGKLVARLKHDDALAADNQATALLPRRVVQPVLLVTTGSHYLERVFEAIPAIQLQVVSVPPENVPPGTIIVYHRQTPERLPRGKVLVIDPTASSDAWTLGEKLDNPLVGKQQSDSPLLEHVRLDNVWMPSARKVDMAERAEPLITTVTGEPIYLAVERTAAEHRGDKLLVLSVDLEQGDLPLRTAFPIMITNAISWFQGRKGELRESLATGSLVEVEREDLSELLPAMTAASDQQDKRAELLLRSPAGKELSLPSGRERLTIGPLDQSGVWTIHIASAAAGRAAPQNNNPAPVHGWQIASNLANAAESDLRPVVEATDTVRADLLGFGGRPIWFYLALLACAVVSFEWFLYQRRWIS